MSHVMSDETRNYLPEWRLGTRVKHANLGLGVVGQPVVEIDPYAHTKTLRERHLPPHICVRFDCGAIGRYDAAWFRICGHLLQKSLEP